MTEARRAAGPPLPRDGLADLEHAQLLLANALAVLVGGEVREGGADQQRLKPYAMNGNSKKDKAQETANITFSTANRYLSGLLYGGGICVTRLHRRCNVKGALFIQTYLSARCKRRANVLIKSIQCLLDVLQLRLGACYVRLLLAFHIGMHVLHTIAP